MYARFAHTRDRYVPMPPKLKVSLQKVKVHQQQDPPGRGDASSGPVTRYSYFVTDVTCHLEQTNLSVPAYCLVTSISEHVLNSVSEVPFG